MYPVAAQEGQPQESESNQGPSSSGTRALPAHLLPIPPSGLSTSSTGGCFFFPSAPAKTLWLPSLASRPTNAFPALGEWYSSKRSPRCLSLKCLHWIHTHLAGCWLQRLVSPGRQVPGHRLSPGRQVPGHHACQALPEPPIATVPSSRASAENSSFSTLGFTESGNKHLTSACYTPAHDLP